MREKHRSGNLYATDSYSDHGKVASAYLKSGYAVQDDADLVLDERITSHEQFAAFAFMVPEWLESGLWHHTQKDSQGKLLLILHTGGSHPNLPFPARHAPLTSPATIREEEQAALRRLRAQPLPAEERDLLQLDARCEAYVHVHKNWQARKQVARERDEDEMDFDSTDEDEDDEGLDVEEWLEDDDDDDDDAREAGEAADLLTRSHDALREDEESGATTCVQQPLEWELADGSTSGFAAASGYLQADDGRVKVGDYMGAIMDGQPHGHGRLTLRSGARWVGEMEHGEVKGYGVLTMADGMRYLGGAIASGEHVLRHGQGSQQHTCGNGDDRRQPADAGTWYHDVLEVKQAVSVAFGQLITRAEREAEDAASAAAGGRACREVDSENGGGSSEPAANADSSVRARVRGDKGTQHAVCQLFRLRRLLPLEHAAHASGGQIEKLERAIAQRPERPWEVRDATAELLHEVLYEWSRNRKLVMEAACTEASQTGTQVVDAQAAMEVQEIWIKAQNVGPELYYQAWKALAKARLKALVKSGAYTPGCDGEKRRFDVTVTEKRDLMARAKLSATEVSLHRNDDLAQRGAMRQELRARAKLDELKQAKARLHKLLKDVEQLRAEIAALEEKRAAEAELANRTACDDQSASA